MFDFLFKKKESEPCKMEALNKFYTIIKEKYPEKNITKDRKDFLNNTITKYGYLPYSHAKALEELTPEETLYGLELKWKDNKVFNNEKFNFSNNNISVLSRNNIKDSSWIQKEGHDIKLINLAGLGNGNISQETGKFLDWLKQLLILPTGNLNNGIFNTTIYLIPFHPREFGCAYLPKSSEVSDKLRDEELFKLTGMDEKEQVKIFIMMAQLAGHPVIYDILPQTGRFSKAVLANPEIARWYDINKLTNAIENSIDEILHNTEHELDADDIEVIKNIYKQTDGNGNLSEHYQKIYSDFNERLLEIKKKLSSEMLKKNEQTQIHKRVKNIVAAVLGVKPNKKLTEEDITKQIEIIQKLIQEGLWPAPGGAWCSAGVPVYDKMSDCGGYPTFKHFDYKGEDVTEFANLDCQTPYYFCYLENGTYNEPVIEYFVNYMKKLQKEYNFDGFRVDHIDHIVDKVSEKDGKPISYRAPRLVLNRLNKAMKDLIPYFGTLAEYMLWDDFLKEYHKDMHFDLLWGNDIVSQSEKTPHKITLDNQHLANYNINFKQGNMLSILKTYNNQDGEFRCIDQYPGQLGENGALYKWFKYKMLPGGKFAQRPILYVDGDESFTQRGIEHVIGEEVSMARENNEKFFKKFDAIDRFVKNNPIITDGEAQIITQEEEGFCAWIISKEPLKTSYLVVSNHKYPTEKVSKTDENGNSYTTIEEGKAVTNKTIQLPGDYKIEKELVIEDNEFIPQEYNIESGDIKISSLEPGEFRIFELSRT